MMLSAPPLYGSAHAVHITHKQTNTHPHTPTQIADCSNRARRDCVDFIISDVCDSMSRWDVCFVFDDDVDNQQCSNRVRRDCVDFIMNDVCRTVWGRMPPWDVCCFRWWCWWLSMQESDSESVEGWMTHWKDNVNGWQSDGWMIGMWIVAIELYAVWSQRLPRFSCYLISLIYFSIVSFLILITVYNTVYYSCSILYL